MLTREILFHVMDGGSNLIGWDLAPYPIPTLISLAQFENKKNSIQTPRGIGIVRKRCHPLILDSGRLTWMKKGLREMAVAELTDRLMTVGNLLGASVIVAGDVPMEPKYLYRVGLSPGEALQITWAANESLRKSKTNALKGYVIQGYEEADYRRSIEVALSTPQVTDVLEGRAVWVIGSVCMAPPAKVVRIAQLVRSLLPGTIHMLGQGRPSVVRMLRSLGIAWADSGTAAGYAARGKWLYPLGTGEFGWKRLHDGRRLPPVAYGLLVRNNIEVLELCVNS